ncbi:MAG: DUF2806 domain-containing protein [Rhodobiaceae bacterium]|nr:DUF2806 domain-containing protein [Rhodobiaceae bacterium]MCC0048653.1 DUF2806 domain-containing protein [Rhodobiaceae bacterium]
MTDEPDDKGEGQKDQNKALVDIKINDIFGLGQVGKQIGPAFNRLIDAVAKGVGGISEPLLADLRRRRERGGMLKSIDALKERGLTLQSANLTLDERGQLRADIELAQTQANREGVAFEAFEQARLLASEDEGDEAGSEAGASDTSEEPVDMTWLMMFWRYAELASEEDVQKLWGAVLARKCLGKGRVPARALQFLSMMDGDDVEAIQRLADFTHWLPNGEAVVIFDLFPGSTSAKRRLELSQIHASNLKRWMPVTRLKDLGLIADSGFAHSVEYLGGPVSGFVHDLGWFCGEHVFMLPHKTAKPPRHVGSGTAVVLGGLRVTELGCALLKLVGHPSPPPQYQQTVKAMARQSDRVAVFGYEELDREIERRSLTRKEFFERHPITGPLPDLSVKKAGF